MLSTVPDFLKDTVTEGLKRLLHPAALFPALIFLILNYLFIFTSFHQHGGWLVRALSNIGPFWQVVLFITVLPMLAYILLSLNTTIFKLASGEIWGDSPLIGWLAGIWPGPNKNLLHLELLRNKEWAGMSEQANVSSPLYPTLKKSRDIPATDFGSIIARSSLYLSHRYDINKDVLWPHMEMVLAKQDAKGIVSRIESEKSIIDFLLALGFVFFVFGIEFFLLQPWLISSAYVFWSLPFFIVALTAYHFACLRAGSLSEAIRMAFDLHREDLRKALRLRECSGHEDEKNLWRKTSAWLKQGGEDIPGVKIAEQIFPVQVQFSSATVISSPNVKVRVMDSFSTLLSPSDQGNGVSEVTLDRYISYTLLVDTAQVNDKAGLAAEGVYIMVSDPRITRINSVPSYNVEPAIATVSGRKTGSTQIPGTQDAEDMVWIIDAMPGNSSLILQYKLHLDQLFYAVITEPAQGVTVKVLNPLAEQQTYTMYSYNFEIRNNSQADVGIVRLKVYDARMPHQEISDGGRDVQKVAQVPTGRYSHITDDIIDMILSRQDIEPEEAILSGSYSSLTWEFGPLKAGEAYNLSYTVDYSAFSSAFR